ncbi:MULTISPECIES: Pr6Pr family membrane protein [unclassified Gilliamella]|uniref:Pr6Pr family membrane protein n=1 Tax=unclassified Gilliamella TaxID=2685620 RepID=UPI001C69582A|nr:MULTISPECIES: Pr6Pr family membrane protein [unclassified Gilliamella]MCX8602042.1 Pr6Pr family membrane protein [Gilliamella sp. B3722]MCX8608339.1 Pr6Pr family membrane protein [Gilliamella sp. B3771]MCX8611312.1 Pr6Pr family membrane protein [Gilliamella sp. B3891]MCX8613884.1 Pr6Pr family membrane protein [Gilliamella sp. B3773]MCX8616326.1 Pr6Pr family membrane protein [Gilliamella sp. B3770]
MIMLKRNIYCLIALYIFFVIGIETYTYWHIQLRPWQPKSPLGRLEYYFSFFTVLSNILLAVSCIFLSLNPQCDRYGFKVIRLNGLIGVVITAIVYNLVLRKIHIPPNSIARFANESLHVIAPALAVLTWLIWGPFRRINFKVVMGSALSLLAYGVYIFVRGYYTNRYPYPFINVTRIGYPKALLAAGIVFLMFVALALLFWGIDALRRRK